MGLPSSGVQFSFMKHPIRLVKNDDVLPSSVNCSVEHSVGIDKPLLDATFTGDTRYVGAFLLIKDIMGTE